MTNPINTNEPIPLGVYPGLGAILGAIGSSRTDAGPIKDKIRGGLTGLGTGLGAAVGAGLTSDASVPSWLLATGIGGGLGYHLSSQALADDDKNEFRDVSKGKVDENLEQLYQLINSHQLPHKLGAAGIPDRSNYGDPMSLPVGQSLAFIRQLHKARRAGEHTDIRIGNEDTGLHSWATKKPMPEPGGRIALFHQPVHDYSYGQFSGTIPSGYGAGTVQKAEEGKALITHVSPEAIHFTLTHKKAPTRFALIKPRTEGDKRWLLVNVTPTEPVPYNKVRYTSIPAEKAESVLASLQPGSSVSAKIDGASSLASLANKHVEVLSYRTAKDTGRPIVHTERFFAGRPNISIPKELEGTVLKGELYGQRNEDQQVIPPQELGGILNATTDNALLKQQQRGVQLKNMVYDIQRLGKDESVQGLPYAERIAKVKEILGKLGPAADRFHTPEEAKTPEEALALWKQIQSGEHPLTREGVVIHPPVGKPMKVKLTDEHDVHIRGIFPGEGKYQGTGAGGFQYSHTPDGPIVGKVGTGLSDETRRMMNSDPQSYIGRVARVRSQQKLPSGALRAPSFLALHEDYPMKQAAEDFNRSELSAMLALSVLGGATGNAYLGHRARQALESIPSSKKQHLARVYKQLGLPKDTPAFHTDDDLGAAYYKPGRNTHDTLMAEVPSYAPAFKKNPQLQEKVNQLGAILHNQKSTSPAVLAHEAGHASIRVDKPWYDPGRLNQGPLRALSDLVSLVTPSAGLYAGMKSQNPLIGAAVGAGVGTLAGLPTLINEYQASSRAKQYLRNPANKLPKDTIDKSESALHSAYGAYAMRATGIPALAGALAGGYGMWKNSTRVPTLTPDENDILGQLLLAKQYSDTRQYKQKQLIMSKLLNRFGDQFEVDSHAAGIVGITHKPTRFRMHLPLETIPEHIWNKYQNERTDLESLPKEPALIG